MPKGHVSIKGLEYVLQEETYQRQLQTPFNPRFSTGDPSFGDLSFAQYLAMTDWSGGTGQEIFDVNNQFFDSEGVNVTKSKEIKLAPRIDFITEVNGPQQEHLNRPVEDEDAWPQIIEWLGRAVIFNDRIESDSGGTEFLEVFETEIIQDKVLGDDPSGTRGTITNSTGAEIISISKPYGVPGDVITVTVKFKKPELEVIFSSLQNLGVGDSGGIPKWPWPLAFPDSAVRFRLDFGGDEPMRSDNFVYQDITYASGASPNFVHILTGGNPLGASLLTSYGSVAYALLRLDREVVVNFTVRVPNKAPGIYKLWTSAAWPTPHAIKDSAGNTLNFPTSFLSRSPISRDSHTDANVLFFIQDVDQILVTRKNLYAPQLKSAAVSGSKLVGGRVIDGVGYIEVYEKQSGSVDRTLQLNLSTATVTPSAPTYIELISNNGIIVAAFDNRIYKIDIETSGLTAAQRFTFIGQVPGSYVSGMAIWNQRVYGGSFDKSLFKSTIWWTDLTNIQGTYDIDGKFWVTDLANFQNGLFYSGGTQDGKGQVRAFPANIVIEVEHPIHDSRVRTLNAGRHLYAGWSHGTGLIVVTPGGASTWARREFADEALNIVWGIEEVGAEVYMLAKNALYKTTDKYIDHGFLETSELGGNTALIDKLWTSVFIEARELTGAHTIRVLATNSSRDNGQWIVLGDMTEVDGREKEFPLPDDFQGQWMKVRVEIETTDPNTSPIIKKIMAKYIPNALQKWQWVFGIRATDGLILLDKSKDARSGLEIINNLMDLKSFGIVTFRDIDDNFYRAIITDMRFSYPLVDVNRQESIVLLEMLEA